MRLQIHTLVVGIALIIAGGVQNANSFKILGIFPTM